MLFRSASGFCVLDNDFSPQQYGGARAEDSRAVTAAHEFFHAIQFGYDYLDDRWFLESTATWMEDQFADSINDNRQYLSTGQVAVPSTPLDLSDSNAISMYGNWAWWEFLTERYGRDLVRKVWTKAGNFPGGGYTYSTAALKKVLSSHGGFAANYRNFSAANNAPGTFYSEGSAWPSAAVTATSTVANATPISRSTSLDHLTAADYRFVPSSGLTTTKAVVSVTGASAAVPQAAVVIRKVGGKTKVVSVPLTNGSGQVTISFSPSTVERATVTLVNASTAFTGCTTNAQTASTWSCGGTPSGDNQPFSLTFTAN